jgi:hypothetical protein
MVPQTSHTGKKFRIMIRFTELDESLRSVSMILKNQCGVSTNVYLCDSRGQTIASNQSPSSSNFMSNFGSILTSITHEYSAVAKSVKDKMQNIHIVTDRFFASVSVLIESDETPTILLIVALPRNSNPGRSVEDLVGLANSIHERFKFDLMPIISKQI